MSHKQSKMARPPAELIELIAVSVSSSARPSVGT